MLHRLIIAIALASFTTGLSATPVIAGHGTGLLPTPPDRKHLGVTHVQLADCGIVPLDFDLRDIGVVPPVKDQGNCGSCWAFSQTASLESALGGKLDLSEQELVSCDPGQAGCNGGNLNDFKYQITHGQSTEASFPYTASDQACKSGLVPAGKGTDFAYVGAAGRSPTIKELQCALYKTHTIPWITVSATSSWGNFPSGDLTVYTRCGHGQPNHAVGVVGWLTLPTGVYFKMRNSWGPKWGSTAGRPGKERGYGLMKLGCDSLGDEAAVIIANTLPCQPPKVKLPAQITVYQGDEVAVGVKAQDGVAYSWSTGETTPVIWVSPTADTKYTVAGVNSCGRSESTVAVKVLPHP